MRAEVEKIPAEILKRIQATVQAEPGISRRKLSLRVCEWMEWRSRSGKFQEVSCRKALLELERRGQIVLPVSQRVEAFEASASRLAEPELELADVQCELGELGEVEIVLVSSHYSQSSKVWNSLMQTHHPLGGGPLCGAQLRYLIRSPLHGWLGGLGFSAPAWRLRSRDEWIGWSEEARRSQLRLVVCNSRFLIAPSIRVPNLASRAMSLTLRRVGQDWQERYEYEPVLVESFIDGAQYSGSSYRAANWVWVGQTAGRSDGFSNGKVSSGKKEIYVYPLRPDFRTLLCEEPPVQLEARRPGAASGWIEQEFGGARLYDPRLRRRLYTIAADFFAQPGVLVPQACEGLMAKAKAAYRFFSNTRTNMKNLIEGHIESTIGRIQSHEVVLAVQDTTTLNYTSHPSTEGIGPINTKKDSAIGMIVHDTMAFSVKGTPLGLLDVQCWARDPDDAGKSSRRKELPIEEKESFKWIKSYRAVAEAQKLSPQTMLVSVADREADIYELFLEAKRHQNAPQLLIRAERSRNRLVEQQHLWEHMDGEPVAGYIEVAIPGKGSVAARTAKLQIHYAAVELTPPKDYTEPLSMWAVYAREVDHGSEIKSPLEWMLLTTVEVSSFEQAQERLEWYSNRWSIEVYHRTLKSGCRIEDRQLNTRERLESAVAIDVVVGWRIHWLTKLSRETPDVPCDVFLQEEEWKVLCAYIRKSLPPDKPPTCRQAARWIARLGGFLGRKSDGEPGVTTMWRGMVKLDGMVEGYQLALSVIQSRASPPPSLTCG
jgi:Druantia protein DruA/Transposase Tn5 dimerisation domain/Transposase DNA-binding